MSRPGQERLLGALGTGLGQVQSAFVDGVRPGSTPEQQARASAAIEFADHLALMLYPESGAMEAKRRAAERKQRGDLQRYALLTMTLLEGLAEIHVPRVTHHVETAAQVAPAAPKRALLILVKAVTGDEGVLARIRGRAVGPRVRPSLRRYHRAIFLGDREAAAAVRLLLESFIRLGWHQAIET